MVDFLWRSVAIGIGGTAAMDLWAVLLTAVFGMPKPNWSLVGRWFAHLAKGIRQFGRWRVGSREDGLQ